MDGWLAVFDLDGTLVETGPDLVETCNWVLAEHGLPVVDASTLHPFIGIGARAMIGAALKSEGIVLSPERIDMLFADYLTHYEGRIANLSKPFPELLAALDTLRAEGVALAVCTNKRERLARKLLDALDLTSRFVAIAGADTFPAMKPDPDHLRFTVEASGGTMERAVFVGDSRVDRETASAAAVPFVGLDYGYSDVPMAQLAPDRLLHRGDDVGAAVLELMRP